MAKLENKLKYLDPYKIEFDKNNPRGLSEKQITDDPNFGKLVSSIKEHGILEPLIVKPSNVGKSKYVLIDGERRLRAATRANQDTVPVLIAKDEIDGRILAYNVHMLRQDWPKAAETKAIKKLITDFLSENPKISEAEIKKKLVEITKHSESEINDLMRLAKYKPETIDKVLSKDLQMSYLVQIEASFIAPLKKKYSDIIDEFGEEGLREILVNKAIDGKLVNTRYLMDEFKAIFKDTEHTDVIRKLLIDFLKTKTKGIDETLKEYQELVEPPKKAKTPEKEPAKPKKLTIKKKKGISFEPKAIKVTKKEQTQLEDVRGKFEKIGSLFSNDETEYIREALFCLEKHCFKASILMSWAAGISRILKYIENNINDFNTATNVMYATPMSVYKHFAKGFQRNATTIDEIRVNSNDRQLICFVYYKKFIKESECKKLLSIYNTRCDCAHPTDIKLSPNEGVSIFDNIHDLIFSNANLR